MLGGGVGAYRGAAACTYALTWVLGFIQMLGRSGRKSAESSWYAAGQRSSFP